MDMDGEGGAPAGPKLPALPADGMDIGVLPRVIRNLVERRAVVKKMLKKEKVCVCGMLWACVRVVWYQICWSFPILYLSTVFSLRTRSQP